MLFIFREIPEESKAGWPYSVSLFFHFNYNDDGYEDDFSNSWY